MNLCVGMKDSTSIISYKQGISYYDERPFTAKPSKPYFIKDQVPIAVLIGPATASSGEMIAISFIGKSNSNLFGEPSQGLTIGNNSFKLSDGAVLVLTYTVDADRNRKKYGGKIQPDYSVNFSNESYDEDNDPVIKEAIRWINNSNR